MSEIVLTEKEIEKALDLAKQKKQKKSRKKLDFSNCEEVRYSDVKVGDIVYPKSMAPRSFGGQFVEYMENTSFLNSAFALNNKKIEGYFSFSEDRIFYRKIGIVGEIKKKEEIKLKKHYIKSSEIKLHIESLLQDSGSYNKEDERYSKIAIDYTRDKIIDIYIDNKSYHTSEDTILSFYYSEKMNSERLFNLMSLANLLIDERLDNK